MDKKIGTYHFIEKQPLETRRPLHRKTKFVENVIQGYNPLYRKM